MNLGAVPEAVELKMIGQKLAYVAHHKKDENIISNCPVAILMEINPAYVKGKCW